MDKTLVQDLLPLVNDRGDMDSLIAFAKYRLDLAHKDLKSATDLRDFGRIQGRIQELEMLISLRDVVVAKAKEYAGTF